MIFGLGYVGLTAAACLGSQGHTVIGIDVNENKIRDLNNGNCPISEPGLEELLATARQNGRFTASQKAGADLDSVDVALICVGTPSAQDGAHNMSFVAEVTRQVATNLSQDRETPLTVVYRSTMRPGSMEEVIAPIYRSILGARTDQLVELIYNPEFLREATAISDYFNPPKIVIGTHDGSPSTNLTRMYEGIESATFFTGYREAEFTKFVDNTWHATKVAFANEIGRLCALLNVDAATAHKIFVADTKLNISAYYLRPGGAFGGSCLPKDVRALQYLANDVGADASLIDSVLRSNVAHKRFVYEQCIRGLNPGARVLLVGLAFKRDSDDLRESPNVDLAVKLLRGGFDLEIVDDAVDTSKLVGQNLGYTYANIPSLERILIPRNIATGRTYDLVVDASGSAGALGSTGKRLIELQDPNFSSPRQRQKLSSTAS